MKYFQVSEKLIHVGVFKKWWVSQKRYEILTGTEHLKYYVENFSFQFNTRNRCKKICILNETGANCYSRSVVSPVT